MDCGQVNEMQAAFADDVAQIRASCGHKHILKALTLLSDTILSYAEGCFGNSANLPVKLVSHRSMLADAACFQAHIIDHVGEYYMQLLPTALDPGYGNALPLLYW